MVIKAETYYCRKCQNAYLHSPLNLAYFALVVMNSSLWLEDWLPTKTRDLQNLIIHSVSRSIKIGSIWCQVGASVGYARWPEQGQTLNDVCHRSDIALYEAKSRGANTAMMFHEEMQLKVTARAKLEGQLRDAIEAGHIRPFYQPLVDLRSGDVCGFEALARWTDEDGVSVSPQVFISIAEETGLITPLFQQLLKTACSDAKHWPEHVSLSFNLSAVQMGRPASHVEDPENTRRRWAGSRTSGSGDHRKRAHSGPGACCINS